MRKLLGLPLLIVAGVASVMPACGTPTQVTFEIRTDVPCGSVKGVAISIGRPGTIEFASPATVTSDCRGGMIGTIATIPSGDDRASIALRVTLGVDTLVENCTAANRYKGCIVARRELAFIPDTALEVPVGLYLGCKDVPCDERTTCKVGSGCIPASVDPGAPVSSSDAGRDGTVLPDATSDGNSPSLDAVASVAVARQFSCARFVNGKVKCWGINDAGQLGLGDTLDRGATLGAMGDALPYVDLGAGRTAKALTAGEDHVCTILDDSRVKCWGNNGFGQLGLGDTQTRGNDPGQMGDSLSFVNLGTGRTAKALGLGTYHTCALLDNNQVKCWGQNADGQLGLGDQLGRGDEPGEMGDALPYVDLGAGRSATAISASRSHTCALLDTNQVKCWGTNGAGQLGLGDKLSRGDEPGEMGDLLSSVDLGAGRSVLSIHAGMGDQTCAVLDNSKVKCWGYNSVNGQLGLGDAQSRGDGAGEMADALPYVDLGAGRTAKRVAPGNTYTCGLLDNDRVKCWGINDSGQLGLGDNQPRGNALGQMGDALPLVELGTGRLVKSLAVGAFHSCAVLDNERVKCWGQNTKGQLGLGDTQNRGDAPGQMGDALPYVKLVGP